REGEKTEEAEKSRPRRPRQRQAQRKSIMKRNLGMKSAVALVVAGMFAISPAMADKPSWAGKGKSDGDERSERHDNQKGEQRGDAGRSAQGPASAHFEERHRVAIYDYYDAQFTKGRCPPGL